ncbi:translocon-associated protein subunit beta-like [Populus alba x Populus x berolinensis]|nr:translocon-associated protein subunit beta-like [Populus alba x Populus x berolinensis]
MKRYRFDVTALDLTITFPMILVFLGFLISSSTDNSHPSPPPHHHHHHHQMANQITTKPLFTLVLSLLLVSSSIASSDVPFIVAHKKATLSSLKPGAERVSVSIDIYNQGSSTAYDITLVDDHWPQDMFNVVTGNTSQSWERLHAGGLLSHSFELEGKVKGLFLGSPAVITFRIPTKAALQEAYSTPILPLDVLADKPPVQKLEWKLLVKYGSLISVISVVVLFVYLLVTPSKSGAAKAGKKRR